MTCWLIKGQACWEMAQLLQCLADSREGERIPGEAGPWKVRRVPLLSFLQLCIQPEGLPGGRGSLSGVQFGRIREACERPAGHQKSGEVRPKTWRQLVRATWVAGGQQVWRLSLPRVVQPWTVWFLLLLVKWEVKYERGGKKRNIFIPYSTLRAFAFVFSSPRHDSVRSGGILTPRCPWVS